MFSSATPQIHSILRMLHCSPQNAVSRMSDIDVNDAFAKRMAQVNLGVFDVYAPTQQQSPPGLLHFLL